AELCHFRKYISRSACIVSTHFHAPDSSRRAGKDLPALVRSNCGARVPRGPSPVPFSMPVPTKLSAESFVGVVKQSALIDGDLFKRTLRELKDQGAALDDPRKIADELVARNLLTRWQADKLLQGRHKGFFLGKYRLLSHLGSGGMSAVYLAE